MVGVSLTTGLAGMLVGLAAGAAWMQTRPLLGALAGAGIGWVCGFIFAFLLASTAEAPDAPDATPALSPMAAGCLHAGAYARSGAGNVFLLAIILTAAYLLLAGLDRLLLEFPDDLGPRIPTLIAVASLTGFLVLGYWMEFFATVMTDTVGGSSASPSLPGLFPPRFLATGIKVLLVLAVYVAPVVTLPLLPLGLLWATCPARVGAFGPIRNTRLALRNAREFVVLWMFLLLWAAALVLAVVVAIGLHRLTEVFPQTTGSGAVILSMTFQGILTAVIGAAAGLFGLAMFRCLGLFARQLHETARGAPNP